MYEKILTQLLGLKRSGRLADLSPLLAGVRLLTRRGSGVVQGTMLQLDNGQLVSLDPSEVLGFAPEPPAPAPLVPEPKARVSGFGEAASKTRDD